MKNPRQDTQQGRERVLTPGPASEAGPGVEGQAATATVETAAADAAPATDAAPAEGAVSAIGLPVDEFHGKGGSFVIRNGVRIRKP